MNNTKPQIDSQAALLRASLEWLKALIKEMKFGTIRGILVTDGVMSKGPEFKIQFTCKPRSHTSGGKRDVKAGDDACDSATRDLALDVGKLKGTWLVEVKLANGLPVEWKREESQPPVNPTTNKN